MALIIKATANKHKLHATKRCFCGKKASNKKISNFGDQTRNTTVIVSKTFFFSR
ncbi:hypothetical protein C8D72_0568 [Kushneria indalinina DSM 14324]|uniref:Uncharacterized protein n=1 Tax=Kushneria indalinina DSM 14324 TaxID=1122140 RepID=A0A3D9DYN5_9GAMM|nr:hypothetical protein C8D72_0568 [Kushneria indalinina DSM 14324]